MFSECLLLIRVSSLFMKGNADGKSDFYPPPPPPQLPFRCRERKGNVHCLPSVTGFSSKQVFNLAEHPTLLYWATHCTYLGFEPRTSQFRRKCSTNGANDARAVNRSERIIGGRTCRYRIAYFLNFYQNGCEISFQITLKVIHRA